MRQADRPAVHDMAQVFDGERESLYLDVCHLIPEGNQIVARRMYEILTAGGPPEVH